MRVAVCGDEARGVSEFALKLALALGVRCIPDVYKQIAPRLLLDGIGDATPEFFFSLLANQRAWQNETTSYVATRCALDLAITACTRAMMQRTPTQMLNLHLFARRCIEDAEQSFDVVVILWDSRLGPQATGLSVLLSAHSFAIDVCSWDRATEQSLVH